MDLATLIGIPAGFCMILGGIIVGGYSLGLYMDLVSVLITIGGSFCAVVISNDMSVVRNIPKYMGLAFKQPRSNVGDLIRQLVNFSEKSRKEGLLSLEDEVEQVQDDFFKQGIKLVVDGTDPEVIKSILYNQISQMTSRHAIGINLMDTWGAQAPAWGMIGTLYGLVGMLANLADPSAIGVGMAAALITTFYGSIVANLIMIPIKTKLAARDEAEVAEREIILEGILSIQSGDNPRIVEEKLLAFAPPSDRSKMKVTSD